jgi:hypothetical protein
MRPNGSLAFFEDKGLQIINISEEGIEWGKEGGEK